MYNGMVCLIPRGEEFIGDCLFEVMPVRYLKLMCTVTRIFLRCAVSKGSLRVPS